MVVPNVVTDVAVLVTVTVVQLLYVGAELVEMLVTLVESIGIVLVIMPVSEVDSL